MADVVVMPDAGDVAGPMEQLYIPTQPWYGVDFSRCVSLPTQVEWAIGSGPERILTVWGPKDGQPARVEVGPNVEVEAAARHLFDLVNQWLAAGQAS